MKQYRQGTLSDRWKRPQNAAFPWRLPDGILMYGRPIEKGGVTE